MNTTIKIEIIFFPKGKIKKVLLSLQEKMQLARELCQEQELLANLPGAMPGMPPGKMTLEKVGPDSHKPGV